VKVVVAGGTGALGRRVCDDLAARGHDVVVLTRGGSSRHRAVRWDGVSTGEWLRELDGSAVVNLSGALVDRRPTTRNVALLTSSRVEPTRALAAAARAVGSVPVLVQASTAAIYGDAGETPVDERSPAASGPPQMAGVATAWERAAAEVPAGRTVLLRTSIVLDRDTPALDRLTSVVRLGLGGRIASGDQWSAGSTSRTGWPSCARASPSTTRPGPARRSTGSSWPRRRTRSATAS
jgi:NAD dependent epimerase/dehydratase family enzyme